MTHVISLCHARAQIRATTQPRQAEADSAPDWVDLARSGAAERLFDTLAGVPPRAPRAAATARKTRPTIRLAG